MLAKFKITFFFILCILAYFLHAADNPLVKLPDITYAKVIKVVDGDTVHLMHKKFGLLKVRLAEIDTPEKNQPYGLEAKKALNKIISNKIVKLKKVTIDRYKRIVGVIYYENMEINYFLVINGHAWCYEKYNQRESIKKAEDYARKNSLGLWNSEYGEPIPPWEWRKKLNNE
tara:strand:+ start:717 stop:1232 length:516 start_codon:yes stop_codon:yes gene_type:complete